MKNLELLPACRSFDPKAVRVVIEALGRLSITQIQAEYSTAVLRPVAPGPSVWVCFAVHNWDAVVLVDDRRSIRKGGCRDDPVRTTDPMEALAGRAKDWGILEVNLSPYVVGADPRSAPTQKTEVLFVDPKEAGRLALLEELGAPTVMTAELDHRGHSVPPPVDLYRRPNLE